VQAKHIHDMSWANTRPCVGGESVRGGIGGFLPSEVMCFFHCNVVVDFVDIHVSRVTVSIR